MSMTPAMERDALIYRVKTAMTAIPPEDLTIEELRAVVAVVEPAADRSGPVDLIGNVVHLNCRRQGGRTR